MRGWLAVLLSLMALALGVATLVAALDVISGSLERPHCRRVNAAAEQPRAPVRIGQVCP
jgi:hypothetical protein